MADLKLQFLGELQVIRGDLAQSLPPSKKTRALLAYLALNKRSFRREQLCELLWEIPDDPRGSLRWSLSKLRRLVDDDSAVRVVADRSHVQFDADTVEIDSLELHTSVANGFDSIATEVLVRLEESSRGQFLEGLELSSFHQFSSWCAAEREQVSRSRIALLNELITRMQSQPESALEYSRQLLTLQPYDKPTRAKLISLMVICGRLKEAEQQFEQGKRLLREVGDTDTTVLHRALKGGSESPLSTASFESTSAARPTLAHKSISKKNPHPVVGRDAQLGLLQSSFGRVLSQQEARCVLFKGEPGIGKSRLLAVAEEIATEANATLLKAGAFESEIVRPFALWNDALRDSSNSEAIDLLSGVERIDRDRLFSSLSRLVEGETKRGPVVILFDDMQWCDESSAAALHFVLRMNMKRSLWVVLGARDEELNSNEHVQRTLRGLRQDKVLDAVQLQPLAEDDVLKLIMQQAPEVDGALISKESRGNPLLAIELARAVAEGNVIGTLNELIGERLSRMNDNSIEMLHWSSVLAPHIELATLKRVINLDQTSLEQSLEEADKQGVLFSADTGLRFSHDLVARSIYKSISSSRRKAMHRRVAELLEVETALDLKLSTELARHASQSGDSALAARSLVLAARLCLRFYANEDAFNLAQRGLEFVTTLADADRVSLTLELKEVQVSAAPVEDWQAAAAEFVALAESALDFGALPAARLGYQMASNLRWAHGHWSGAKREILQAERVTRGASEEVHILGMAEAARCLLLLERDVADADALLMEASSRAERKRINSDALAAAKGMLRYYENNLTAAESLLEEARARSKVLGERLNEFQANEYLYMIEIERESYDDAQLRCQALLTIGSKLRQGSEEPFARAAKAFCDYVQGGTDEAMEPELQSLRDCDAKQRLTYFLNRAALHDNVLEKWDSAIARASEAIQNAKIMDRASEIITAHVALAQAYQGKGDLAALDQQLQALLAIPDKQGAKWARARAEKFVKSQVGN